MVFIDDILVYSRSKEGYAEHLRIVLKNLEEHKLYAKYKKCDFWMGKVHLLGKVISKEGVCMDPAKVEAVVGWPRSTNITKVQRFLGMTAYYRIFAEGFFKLALPLTKLLHKDN